MNKLGKFPMFLALGVIFIFKSYVIVIGQTKPTNVANCGAAFTRSDELRAAFGADLDPGEVTGRIGTAKTLDDFAVMGM